VNSAGRYPPWAPYFFISPFVVLFLVFTVYPLIYSVVLSLHQTYGPKSRVFIFLANFAYLLSDPLFWKAFKNTTIFAAVSVFVQLPLSLGLAMLLNRNGLKARSFFRLVFFSPSLVGTVFVAMIFSLVFEKRTGLLNVALHKMVGFDPDFPWLQEYVMPAIIIASLWMYIGFNMIYFLAALQSVSQELTEAATVDGANAWQRFYHITLPAIRPVGSFVLLLSLIGSFQLFELPYLLLGETGGPNNQGLTIVMYLYQTGFETGDLGYASAIGWSLAILLGGFAMAQRRISKASEY
jgi:ABC-type sugar transport system permease subunit